MELLKHLKAKNKILSELERYTLDHIHFFEEKNFDFLDAFVKKRALYIKTLEIIDQYISKLSLSEMNGKISSDVLEEIKTEDKYKEFLLQKIIEMDALIQKSISSEIDEIGVEIDKTEKSKNIISKFKSNSSLNLGGGVDKKL